MTPTNDREPRGEQTPGKMPHKMVRDIANIFGRAEKVTYQRPGDMVHALYADHCQDIAAALRTLLREHEAARTLLDTIADAPLKVELLTAKVDQLTATVAALEAELAAERAARESWEQTCRRWRSAVLDACVPGWVFEDKHRNDPQKAIHDLLEVATAAERAAKEAAAQWYAVRWERLRKLIHDDALARHIEDQACSIMANGTADSMEPPTYDQQINVLRRERDEAQAEAKRLGKLLADEHKIRLQAEGERDEARKAKDLLRHDLEFTIYSQQVEHAKALAAVEAERDEAIQARDIAAETAALCSSRAEQAEADAAARIEAIQSLHAKAKAEAEYREHLGFNDGFLLELKSRERLWATALRLVQGNAGKPLLACVEAALAKDGQ